jgi:hypothetical protein
VQRHQHALSSPGKTHSSLHRRLGEFAFQSKSAFGRGGYLGMLGLITWAYGLAQSE